MRTSRLLVGLQFALLIVGGWQWVEALPPSNWTWACLAVGLAIAIAGALGLGSSLTPLPIPNGNGLRTGGLFRFVRHPIYLGVLISSLAFVDSGPIGTAAAVALAGVLVLKIRIEETMLNRVYSGYAEYARQTWRLLPFVW